MTDQNTPGAQAVNFDDLLARYDRDLAQANRRALIAESSVAVWQQRALAAEAQLAQRAEGDEDAGG